MTDKKIVSEQNAIDLQELGRKSRRFLGNVPADNAFDKAHLKAYLKGSKYFRHGFYFDTITQKRQATIHKVQQEYGYINN